MYPSSSSGRGGPVSRERFVWVGILCCVAFWGVHQANLAAYHSGALEALATRGRERIHQPNTTPLEAKEALENWVKPAKLLVSQTATRSMAHNLLPDVGYVTAFHYGGFTNQLNSFIKLAYFAKMTDRVLILPEFWPQHHQGTEPPFTEFFDIDRWSALANVSIVNWQDVKLKQPPVPEPVQEKLSCWGTGSSSAGAPLGRYNIETAFWPIADIYRTPRITVESLRLMLSQDQSSWLASTKPYGKQQATPPAPPNEQLVCFDNAFWLESLIFNKGKVDRLYSIEEFPPYSPVWTEVGQHLHFNKRVEREVDRLMSLLLPDDKSGRPEFIGLHFRQRDFLSNGRVKHDPIADVARELKTIRKRLADETGRGHADRMPVIVATDSDDPVFLGRLKAKGWIRVAHEQLGTKKTLGAWWPEILDGAILARATGFVGTKLSTMSYLQARRVESWQGGVSETVG